MKEHSNLNTMRYNYETCKNNLLQSGLTDEAYLLLKKIIYSNENILKALAEYIEENISDKNAINLFTLTPQYIYMQSTINQTENMLMYHLNKNQQRSYKLYSNVCKSIFSDYIKKSLS